MANSPEKHQLSNLDHGYYDAPQVVTDNDAPEVVVSPGLHPVIPGKEAVYSQQFTRNNGFPDNGNTDKEVAASPERQSRICGLSRRIFWLVLVGAISIILIAVGASVGGAVAGIKAKNDNSATTTASSLPQSTTAPSTPSASPTPSATPSSTTPAAPVPTDIGGCPTVNETIFIAQSGKKFQKICYNDILGGPVDIHHATAQTLDSCIGLCDSWNTANGAGSCKSVTWDMTGGNYQLCWLKNATKTLVPNTVIGDINSTVAAILLS